MNSIPACLITACVFAFQSPFSKNIPIIMANEGIYSPPTQAAFWLGNVNPCQHAILSFKPNDKHFSLASFSFQITPVTYSWNHNGKGTDNFNCFNQEFINLSSHNDKKRKSGKMTGKPCIWMAFLQFCIFYNNVFCIFLTSAQQHHWWKDY